MSTRRQPVGDHTVADNNRASGCQHRGHRRPLRLTGRTRGSHAYCSRVSTFGYYIAPNSDTTPSSAVPHRCAVLSPRGSSGRAFHARPCLHKLIHSFIHAFSIHHHPPALACERPSVWRSATDNSCQARPLLEGEGARRLRASQCTEHGRTQSYPRRAASAREVNSVLVVSYPQG